MRASVQRPLAEAEGVEAAPEVAKRGGEEAPVVFGERRELQRRGALEGGLERREPRRQGFVQGA